jgi:two-component sensor histidine kinase
MKDESAIEALRMAKNRIITISHIENKINDASKSIEIGAFIKEISETILNALSGEENIKYKIQYNLCEQQLTKINTTLIGLILNELITNATKYAFNKYEPKNTVTIGCSINYKTLTITVSDNGKGYKPAGIPQNSMGIDLVKDMVEQMGGAWKIDSLNGTKNHIEIPIN